MWNEVGGVSVAISASSTVGKALFFRLRLERRDKPLVKTLMAGRGGNEWIVIVERGEIER